MWGYMSEKQLHQNNLTKLQTEFTTKPAKTLCAIG